MGLCSAEHHVMSRINISLHNDFYSQTHTDGPTFGEITPERIFIFL